jgi:aminoglycoside phosphotransferase (APT) family kinase protein
VQIPFRELLGREPDRVEKVFDYGYRGVWKAFAGKDVFVVKFDYREGSVAKERAAQVHAAAGGIPVPGIAGYTQSPACLALEWVPGVALSDQSGPGAAHEAGSMLRRVHALPPLARRLEPLAEWLHLWFEKELDYMVGRAVLASAEREQALRAFEALRPVLEATPCGWIHGDCQAAHFLIDRLSGRVNAVIDWADAQHGPPEIDFAVLTLFDPGLLGPALDGYGADAAFRERLRLTLPLYQAIRGAGAYHWLEENGYTGHLWPMEKVRALAARG